MLSFTVVLREAPILLEALPPEALKALSATCRSLRTLFCAQVKVISLSDVEDASKLCGTTWPQLLMVVYTSEPKLASKLSAEWECMMEMSFCSRSAAYGPWPAGQGPWPGPREIKTAGLVQSRQQVHTPLMGLQEQQSAVLSVFADQHRHAAQKMTLQGPLVGYRVVQTLSCGVWPNVKGLYLCGSPQLAADSMSLLNGSLPKMANVEITHCHSAALELLNSGTAWRQVDIVNLAHNQLDASALSLLPQASWTHLRSLTLDHNMIGVSGMQHLVACSWPFLKGLLLANTGLDELALRCLAEGQWPKLNFLDLSENNICAQGISSLIQGSWPLLATLVLSEQALGEEVCSLLGIPHLATTETQSSKSSLVQFPLLHVCVW